MKNIKKENKKIIFDTGHRNNNILIDEQLKQMHENMQKSWWNRPARWFAAMLAVSIVLSYVDILRLGEGGSVTFLSMLVLCLIGYVLEPKYGLLAAFLFGVIKYLIDYVCPGYFQTVINRMINDPGYLGSLYDYVIKNGYRDYHDLIMNSAGVDLTADPDIARIIIPGVDAVQVIGDLFDYLIGYTLLGLFGYIEAIGVKNRQDNREAAMASVQSTEAADALRSSESCGSRIRGSLRRQFTLQTSGRRRLNIQTAYIIVVLLRFVESVINYIIFYPEDMAWSAFVQEAVMYSFMYVVIEGILSWFVLYIPPVIDTIQYFRTVAGNEYNEKLYQEYR